MKKIMFVIFLSALFTGCASVKMEDKTASDRAKQFAAPSSGNAGLYIYRNLGIGTALKKDIRVDGKCIGESAPGVFFLTEVSGDKTHEVTTESEFSPNKLSMIFNAGKNYFIRQYIKFGVFVGGADLELVTDEEGKEEIRKLALASNGVCGE
jgi:hypothetical protein